MLKAFLYIYIYVTGKKIVLSFRLSTTTEDVAGQHSIYRYCCQATFF